MLLALELDSGDKAEHALYECLSRGLSFKVSSGTVLTLTPPLVISDLEIDEALGILDTALAIVAKSPSAPRNVPGRSTTRPGPE